MIVVHGREYCVKAVLTALAEGGPKSAKQISSSTGIDERTISHLLSNLWRKDLILRTDKLLFEYSKRFKGRASFKSNTRIYRLYVINYQTRQRGEEEQGAGTENTTAVIDGYRFVQFSSEYSDKRGNVGLGRIKAKRGIS